MPNPFRRSRPDPLQLLQEGLPEENIAVGALSGVDPADIAGHLLVVVTRDGRIGLTGTGTAELAVVILTELTSQLARQAYEDGPDEQEANRG